MAAQEQEKMTDEGQEVRVWLLHGSLLPHD
jgi:hypothetical protein